MSSAHSSKLAKGTAALAWLQRQGLAYSCHCYPYQERGGALHAARALGLDPLAVVKTLIMQDEVGRPLAVLMHGIGSVSTQALARQIGVKSVQPCTPGDAQRYSGYLVGGISPFGFKRAMPIWVEATVLELPRIWVNGGRRGLLLGLAPALLLQPLGAQPVHGALAK